MPLNRDAYLRLGDAAKLAGVKPKTLFEWRRRGWIATTDADGNEYPPNTPNTRRYLTTRPGKGLTLEYRAGDVLDAARDTAANPRNPGRETRVLVLA